MAHIAKYVITVNQQIMNAFQQRVPDQPGSLWLVPDQALMVLRASSSRKR